MAMRVRNKNATPITVAKKLRNALGSAFTVSLSKDRLTIDQGGMWACYVRLKWKGKKFTFQGPYGIMPSPLLRLAIAFPCVAGFVAIGAISGHGLLAGFGPLIAILIMKGPAQSIVNKVKPVMEQIIST